MKYQPSIGTPSATAASESDASGAMCDMACQTRWVISPQVVPQAGVEHFALNRTRRRDATMTEEHVFPDETDE